MGEAKTGGCGEFKISLSLRGLVSIQKEKLKVLDSLALNFNCVSQLLYSDPFVCWGGGGSCQMTLFPKGCLRPYLHQDS